jgi:hypothetical protein
MVVIGSSEGHWQRTEWDDDALKGIPERQHTYTWSDLGIYIYTIRNLLGPQACLHVDSYS